MNKYNMKPVKENAFWNLIKINKITPVKTKTSLNILYPKPLNPYPYNPKKILPKVIKVTPQKYFGIPNPKPVSAINTNINLPKREMNWFQANSKFPKLNPYGDADKDGVINMLDCKPFNRTMQDAKSKEYFKKLKQNARPLNKITKRNQNILKQQKQGLEELMLHGKYVTAKMKKDNFIDTIARDNMKDMKNPKNLKSGSGMQQTVQLGEPLERDAAREAIKSDLPLMLTKLDIRINSLDAKLEDMKKSHKGKRYNIQKLRIEAELKKDKLKRDKYVRKIRLKEAELLTESKKFKAAEKTKQMTEYGKAVALKTQRQSEKGQEGVVSSIATITKSIARVAGKDVPKIKREEKWTDEKLERKIRERDIWLKEIENKPENIVHDEIEKIKKRNIEKMEKERNIKENQGIIFDVPTKSPIKRFVEKITGKKTGAIVNEELSTNEYTSFPTTKNKEQTQEEKEILERTKDEMKERDREEKENKRLNEKYIKEIDDFDVEEERYIIEPKEKKEKEKVYRTKIAEEKPEKEEKEDSEKSAQELIDEA